jgi:epoxide hydrolase 4
MAVEHRFIDTNGVRLHCAVDGEGPLVILLHGFPECWYSWRHQIAALAPRFRVVAPDMRGYNESDKPAGLRAYAMSELVADVDGLLRAFGEHEAVIVGHDWGGAVAWNFAMERPNATRRLVVLNCPHPAIFAEHLRVNRRQLMRSWYMFFFQLPWLPEWVIGRRDLQAVEQAFRQMVRRTDREVFSDHDIEQLKQALRPPGALRAAINYYRATFRDVGAMKRYRPDRLIDCPTLLIWAEEDDALGKELTYGMERLFHGPFAIKYVPQCSHWVQQEQPEVVNQELLAFLRRP